jgi:serine/threonine protein kinase
MQVFYAGEDNGVFYFVMEYIDGMDLGRLLGQYVTDGELIPQSDILRIVRAVASALDYAHQRGVIHRDVKPANIMVSADGRIVLADFGLAMDIQQGTMGEIFGTPHYIAPEQARRSADAVPQSDLYSLGVILYEMLTGTVPFDDPSPASLALQHMTQPPPPPREINPALSEETERVLLKVLSKLPADRYQSGSELIWALETSFHPNERSSIIELPPIPAGMQSIPVAQRVANYASMKPTPLQRPEPLAPAATQIAGGEPTRPWWRGIRGLAVGGVVILLIAVGLIILSLIGNEDNKDRPDEDASVALVTEVATEKAGSTPTQPLPTSTQAPEQTQSPAVLATETSAPIVQATTDIPTATVELTQVPTNTLEPTIPPSEVAAPTVMYPNGRHVTLYYNENSLYLHNLSGDRIALGSFAMERLFTSGAISNRFDGVRWAQFFPYVMAQSCASLLMANSSPFLNPGQCQSNNAEVWATRGLSLDFWTPQTDSTQFRVLWNNEEVARCEIAAGTCEVFLP